MRRKFTIALGVLAAAVTILVIQRDFLYGTRGNLGQGTHPVI